MTQTPAGWYPAPENDGRQRYWDGTSWTDHYAPGGNISENAATPAQTRDPDAIWQSVGKPVTGIGAGKYKLTAHYLFFEKGTLRTDSQQVPIAAVLDVDVTQSMTQKARSVGTVIVHIQRPTGVERVPMVDVPDFREAQRAINETAHGARAAILRSQNTHRYESHATHTPVPAQPAAAPAAATPDYIAQLKQLGGLRDAGVLSEDEFAAKKADILNRM